MKNGKFLLDLGSSNVSCTIAVTAAMKHLILDILTCMTPENLMFIHTDIEIPVYAAGSAYIQALKELIEHLDNYKWEWEWDTDFFE